MIIPMVFNIPMFQGTFKGLFTGRELTLRNVANGDVDLTTCLLQENQTLIESNEMSTSGET